MSGCRSVAAFLSLAVVAELWAAEALPPIGNVEITARRSFLVNGKRVWRRPCSIAIRPGR